MTVILMSRSEIDRMNVLRDLAEERIRVSEAATLMGLGRRQVLRLAEGISATRPCCSGVAPTREAKQPFLSGGSAGGSDRYHPRVLCELRVDACWREARGTARH
jgi:hypothetical protein